MFKHYLIIALRNLVKNKINSAIKIIGLGLGLAAVLTVIIVNYSELTWDSFWQDADQIYLVRSESRIGNRQEVWDSISEIHYPQLRANLNDQLWMTKIESSGTEVSLVNANERLSLPKPIPITQVDPDFLAIFQPEILAGDLSAFAGRPDVAFISQTLAKQIFGKESPIGKLLEFRLPPTITQQQSGEQPALQQVRIIAVVDIDNSRSHIKPAIFFPRLQNPPISPDQAFMMRETYVKTKKGLGASDIETLLNKTNEASFSKDEENKYGRVNYSLMPITERHMNDSASEGNRTRVVILSLLGLVILIVAIGNFISLGLAGYVARQKEVALRRVQGAGIAQLVAQYWLENLVYVTAAFLLALILCELFLPHLAGLLQFPLVDGIFVSPVLALICVAMVLLVSLFIACYPALYFSKMNPAIILRANRSTETPVSIITRKVLLLVQFIALVSLVIGLASIHSQLKLINQYQPGYKTEGIVMVIGQGNTGLGEVQRETLKQELTKIPGFIAAASPMGDIPGRNEHTMDISSMVNDELHEHRAIYDWVADADYFDAYGITLIAGTKENIITSLNKPFSQEQSGPSFDTILCRATATALGFASPQEALGQTIQVFKQPGMPHAPSSKIIGVVENLHIGDHRKAPMDCMYMTLNTIGLGGMAFAVSFDHEPSVQEIENIKTLWSNAAGTPPHHWLFSNSLADRYRNEQRLQLFMSGFALVALIIGLLGIYGITALNTQKRAREIALRKLHGAKHWQIIRLLNRDFSLIAILANVIAWPMAIYAVSRWLENFHQHFSLVLWLPIFCAVALAISLLVVWLTVTLHSLSIGHLRPAEVLRDE